VASEICGTSISSRGSAQERVNETLRHNPHVHYGRADQRGHVICQLDADALQASLMVVEKPEEAHSAVNVAARFVIDAKQPGIKPA
jgi:alkaline phosphatase D